MVRTQHRSVKLLIINKFFILQDDNGLPLIYSLPTPIPIIKSEDGEVEIDMRVPAPIPHTDEALDIHAVRSIFKVALSDESIKIVINQNSQPTFDLTCHTRDSGELIKCILLHRMNSKSII